MQTTRRVALAVIAALFTAALLVGAYAVPKLMEGVDDAYAQWGAADMVIAYMDDHNGDWPRSWNALEPYFAESNGRVGGWSFKRFRSRVSIDFQADPNELRAASMESQAVSFDVIHATSVWGCQFDGGPNAMLHSYFRDRDRREGDAMHSRKK